MIPGAISLVVVGCLALGACDADRREEVTESPVTTAKVNVVAKVGSGTIGAADVAARMAEDGSSRDQALDDLVREELLVQEAIRRGIEVDPAEQRSLERLMVRAMLRDFEEVLTPESIPEKEVRADFERYQERYQVPERRRSWHILAKDRSEAGRALADSILGELQSGAEPDAVRERYAEGGGEETGIEVVVEELPPVSTKAGLETSFKDALFEPESPGLVDRAVETSYGWHVIYLSEIIPGERRELADVEVEIRNRLSQKKRFQNLVDTIQRLEAQGLVEYHDGVIARLLSNREAPTRVGD